QRNWLLVRDAALADRPQRRCHVLLLGERFTLPDRGRTSAPRRSPAEERPRERLHSQLGLGRAEHTRAERQMSGWRSITLWLPPGASATFSIDQGNGGRPDKRAQLTS